MPNWTESMQQTFEYYTVDPNTWKDVKKLEGVKSATIEWDSEADTFGSATIDVEDSIGETYVRIYLITIQNGVTEKHPLGTFLIQTLPSSFDGKTKVVSTDAYTPLIELKEKYPPIGYYVPEKTDIMQMAYNLTKENVRAPVVNVASPVKRSNRYLSVDFVSDTDDTWLDFLKSLMANAEYSYKLDELGRIMFSPKQDMEAMQPVQTFTDDNSSILYPDISMSRDLYGIPNVVEVIYSSGSELYHHIEENNDSNSPTSIKNRGRRIVYRETNPEIVGIADRERVEEYTKLLLRDLSSLECTVTYTHGYCPVRVGDCVRLNYSKFGLTNLKAKVISQTIKCVPGCPVTEKAVFTTKLWRR